MLDYLVALPFAALVFLLLVVLPLRFYAANPGVRARTGADYARERARELAAHNGDEV